MSVSEMNIGRIRRSHVFMRAISWVVLITFASVTMSPGAKAIAQTVENANTVSSVAAQQLAEEKSDLGKALGKAKQQLRVIADLPDASNAKPTAAERAAKKEELKSWREELRRLDTEVRAEFDSVGATIAEKKLPDVIKARHAEALAKYQTEISAFNADLDAALSSSDDAVVKAKAEAAYKRLNATQLGRSQQDFDPNNLPNSTLKPDRNRVPKTTAEEFQSSLLLADHSIRLAQTSGFDFSQLVGASDPNYLAATTEVVLTEDIKAKADELHRNPVEIYNWVRNNVQWQPTWGAIQDASHTLSAQRGNAFDIASLTIALLRASGIPARYVHGTIDVPEAIFRNWAGGFQYINAAIDFASAGGIPITTVISAGKITKVRMEHIWVEAAVDFKPSRGAKNRVADTWVAMDPSFKQLEILKGLDAMQVSSLDPALLGQSFLASGTVNQAEGWATGFDPGILRNAQDQAKTEIENYIATHLPNATVGDVFGGRKIIVKNTPVLAVSLPNRIVAIGAHYATVPTSLQQQIDFAFGKDIEGFPIYPKSFPWAQLSNKQVTLSFRPATLADEQTLRSLVPEGEISSISQLPASIPSYLVYVVPELKVDGTVVMSGSAMVLGADLTFIFNPKFVSSGERPFSYSLPAGSYLAVAVVAGGLCADQLRRKAAKLDTTKTSLGSSPPPSGRGLSRERLLGDIFDSAIQAYYGQYLTLSYLSGLRQSGHHELAAGLGTFGYEPNVNYLFGIPRSITSGSAAMNIPMVNVIAKDAPGSEKQAFTIQLGAISSVLEHTTPEQLFGMSAQGGEAISAMKALQKASASGQKVFQINSANQSSILPILSLDSDTMYEIRAALSAGKTVITHQNPVKAAKWTGVGYVIVDLVSGDGAWKIAGGSNGGDYTDDSPLLSTASGALLASMGDVDMDSIVGFLRTILLEVLLDLAKKVVLNVLSIFVDFFQNLLVLWESCFGLDFFWSALLIVSLMVAALFYATLFKALLVAITVGLVLGSLINQVLSAAVEICTARRRDAS